MEDAAELTTDDAAEVETELTEELVTEDAPDDTVEEDDERLEDVMLEEVVAAELVEVTEDEDFEKDIEDLLLELREPVEGIAVQVPLCKFWVMVRRSCWNFLSHAANATRLAETRRG